MSAFLAIVVDVCHAVLSVIVRPSRRASTIRDDRPRLKAPSILRTSPNVVLEHLSFLLDEAGFIARIECCDGGRVHRAGDGLLTFIIDATPASDNMDVTTAMESVLLAMLSLPAMVLVNVNRQRFTALGIGGNPALVAFCRAYSASAS